VQEAIAKARSLIEAMEYIRGFRGRIVVVKLGGSVLDAPKAQRNLLTDVAFMATGGKAITRAMNEAGMEPVWVQGRRYTDRRTLNIVEHTLVKKVNEPICRVLEELGCNVMGLHSLSSCVLLAELRAAGRNAAASRPGGTQAGLGLRRQGHRCQRQAAHNLVQRRDDPGNRFRGVSGPRNSSLSAIRTGSAAISTTRKAGSPV